MFCEWDYLAACTAIDGLPNLVLPSSIAVYGYAILSDDVTVIVGVKISEACLLLCLCYYLLKALLYHQV